MALGHCRLGVNVDHVATIRQARRAVYPDPVTVATFAELGGADQITIHLREDRRHIQDRDLRLMRHTVRVPLNLEMAATEEMVRIAQEVRPEIVTLVPERREEVTTEGGLDAVGGRDALGRVIRQLKEAEIEVSLFIDPDLDQVRMSHKLDADRVEFHTGRYCELQRKADKARELQRLADACKGASRLGLHVAAGHGLNYENVLPVAALPEMEELNIGHALVARSVFVGMERAVREMVELIRYARR